MKPTLFDWQKQGAMKVSGDIAKNFRNEALAGNTSHLYMRGSTAAQQAAAIFAREAIQNSLDSHMELKSRRPELTDKLHVACRFVYLYGSSKTEAAQKLGISEIADRVDTAEWSQTDGLSRDTRKELKRIAGSGKDPLVLLYIEEHGSAGMYTYGTNPGDCKLVDSLFSNNYSNKNSGSGGSFGQGKSALAASSAIRTVYAYSSYPWIAGEPESSHNAGTAKLAGAAYLPIHTRSGAPHTGIGYFDEGARYRADGDDRIVPYTGEDAHIVAGSLGFTVRDGLKDNGTCILVVAPNFAPEDLHLEISNNWWPAIVDGQLTAEVTTEVRGGSADDAPEAPGQVDPDKVENLTGFTAAWRKLDTNPATRFEGGRVGVELVNSLVRPGVAERFARGEKVNSHHIVARVRNIGMVVRYDKINAVNVRSSTGTHEIRGVFRAEGEKVCDLLRRAEPKAHDDWVRNPATIEGAELKTYRALLQTILNEIKKAVKEAAEKAAGRTDAESKPSQLLSNLLGDISQPGSTSPNRTSGGRSRKDGQIDVTVTSSRVDETAGKVTLKALLTPADGADRLTVEPRYLVEGEGGPALTWHATQVAVAGRQVEPDGNVYTLQADRPGGTIEVEFTVAADALAPDAPELSRAWKQRLSCMWAI